MTTIHYYKNAPRVSVPLDKHGHPGMVLCFERNSPHTSWCYAEQDGIVCALPTALRADEHGGYIVGESGNVRPMAMGRSEMAGRECFIMADAGAYVFFLGETELFHLIPRMTQEICFPS